MTEPKHHLQLLDIENVVGMLNKISILAGLSEKQRVSVLLVTGFGWKLSEVAELLGISVSTVQNHVERGLKNLRSKLGAEA